MPMYDRQCEDGHQRLDCWEPISTGEVPCKECGKPTERVWLTSGASVISDGIPGGVLISHGICHADGSPKRYYSKSDINKAAKAAGLTRIDRHVTSPKSGSDKNPHTKPWF